MSAFGRKNGPAGINAGARPQFGVAKPMRGGTPTPSPKSPEPDDGGEQFPPLPTDAPE
ncbi:MAG TPA: flagellar protein FlaI, partial [Erythrobacter sp.]|nr:flagellar protein FlaI [Erythrobacter sp.]HCH96051.1 flagellar protein FlaI [Erythrobacter sp.]